jgi:hypothetical protein
MGSDLRRGWIPPLSRRAILAVATLVPSLHPLFERRRKAWRGLKHALRIERDVYTQVGSQALKRASGSCPRSPRRALISLREGTSLRGESMGTLLRAVAIARIATIPPSSACARVDVGDERIWSEIPRSRPPRLLRKARLVGLTYSPILSPTSDEPALVSCLDSDDHAFALTCAVSLRLHQIHASRQRARNGG